MNLTLTFATRYNGVYLSVDDPNVEVTEEMDDIFDDVSDTFPSYTGEMADNWGHTLTPEQERELCQRAADFVRSVIPDPIVSFEYDHYSS